MSEPKSENIRWHHGEFERSEREQRMGQRGCVVWFTGLSGSGKSTVSRRVESRLVKRGRVVYTLDGDNLRYGLNRDLGFSPEDRVENIRRVAAVAELFADAGVICLTAFISPYQSDRDAARALVPDGRFIEVFVDTPLAVCEARDPKGLYVKARAGALTGFTGIDAPYEAPAQPEVRLDTTTFDLDACAQQVIDALERRGLFER